MRKLLVSTPKIVIIGPRTDIGQCILGQLAQHNFPTTAICPLDIHQESGKTVYYNNHPLTTQPLDSFDFHNEHIIFICDKKIIPRIKLYHKNHCDWWIDCTHSVREAQCIIPDLNGTVLKTHPKWICNPCSNVIALARVLTPVINTYQAQSIQLLFLMGTLFQGPEATDALITQIRHHLVPMSTRKNRTHPQLAFNVIPDYFAQLATMMTRQMHCFIKVPISIHTCFVPVIRGSCAYVHIQLQRHYGLKSLVKKWQQIPDLRLYNQKTILGLNELITEDKIFILHPTLENNTLSFWCLQDVIQHGIGTNAALLAQYIYKMNT